ncbi:hypothetical protein EW399_23425 [Salmonella enterica subsp. enterica serovar Leoben]|nr:hypothetical protein [Salmonella enterica subsp. enterica serovar Leoben]ECE9265222.1 hypothetical protein [Salmonella enterica subsp. enterica serovar Leoben]ECE9398511.1 hypothetical protein [Salmonella enterica subsp. enterica serovar Leoben]
MQRPEPLGRTCCPSARQSAGGIVRLIERLEKEDNKMKIPHSPIIGGGIFELRKGKNIAITLYAFLKKTQKTPAKAIEITKMRLKEMN